MCNYFGALANSSIDFHIDANGLTRDGRERLRFGTQVPGLVPLHIQNIIAGRKYSLIISVSVRSNARDLLSLRLAQNDQRIFSIHFRRDGRPRHFVARLNQSS
jgi:hypothetical protein